MAIVKETGTGSALSNSYVDADDVTAYIGDRGVTIAGTVAELLIQAMDYIESKRFIGDKGSKAQALQWPRWGASVDGYYIDTDSIPTLLQEAQIEVAIAIDGGVNPLAIQSRETLREKVGPIEVEYSPSSRAVDYLTAAETKLDKLIRGNFGAYRA